MKRFSHILCFSMLYVILWTGTSYAVVPTLSIAKNFGAASIPLNGTTTLTFTITNPPPYFSQSQVAFTDTLPAGLVVATPNGLTNSCGGTPTAVAGSTSISLTSGTIALHSDTCTVVVNVTGTVSGNYNNTSGTVSSNEGGTGNTATANLTVTVPAIPATTGNGNITLDTTTPGCGFTSVSAVTAAGHGDPSFNYPYGLVAFTLNCASATVTITFPGSIEGKTYRKYGPTPDDPTTPHWYDFMYDGTTGAEINGNQVVLHFVDGQRGDDDLTANSVIVDDGGPGDPVVSIPSMTEWGTIIFIVFAGLGAIYYMRIRKTATS